MLAMSCSMSEINVTRMTENALGYMEIGCLPVWNRSLVMTKGALKTSYNDKSDKAQHARISTR